MKTLLIVADSCLIVETIRLALRTAAELNVIGELDGRAYDHGTAAAAPSPHIVLVDEMEDAQHALERIAECRDELPDASVVVLTMRWTRPGPPRALPPARTRACRSPRNLPGLGAIILEVVNRNIVSALPPPAPFADWPPLTGRPA